MFLSLSLTAVNEEMSRLSHAVNTQGFVFMVFGVLEASLRTWQTILQTFEDTLHQRMAYKRKKYNIIIV